MQNTTEYICFKDELCGVFVFGAWREIVKEQFGGLACTENTKVSRGDGNPLWLGVIQ